MNAEQELALITSAQQGNTEALGKLWNDLTPKLFGYLINTTQNKTLAEDMLQSTWLKAVEALPRYTYRGVGFSAWLFAIARNECLQHWRKSKRETEFNPELHDRQHEDSRNALLIDQLLGRLTEADRELVRLRYIADLSINEIAAVLQSNTIAVRVRLHRAMNKLKDTASETI